MKIQNPAPAWRVRVRCADDVDAHAANLSGWRQRYDQLGAGAFAGRLDEVVGEGVQLFREQTSRLLRQRCELWEGAVWCGITATDDGSRLDGRAGGAGGVMVSGTGFELVSPAGHDIVGFVVAREVLAAHAQAQGRELNLEVPSHASWRHLAPGQRRAALAHARAILALAAALPARIGDTAALSAYAGHTATLPARAGDTAALGRPVHPLHARGLRTAMLDVAADLFAAPAEPLRERGNASSRRRLVQLVRERVEADPDRAPNVPELCEALHVSRRTLQYAFEDEVGIGALAYLRGVRLNGVRRLLREGAASVQQAAAQWGWLNMSQFAADYRRQFGESASQTRGKSAG